MHHVDELGQLGQRKCCHLKKEAGLYMGGRSAGGGIRVSISIRQSSCSTIKISTLCLKSSLSGTCLKCVCMYAYTHMYCSKRITHLRSGFYLREGFGMYSRIFLLVAGEPGFHLKAFSFHVFCI